MRILSISPKKIFFALLLSGSYPLSCLALPLEDVPEEILRTEIILEGRSPIDGKPLSASEYEELQASLSEPRLDPKVNSDIRQLVFLLQLRKLLKTIIPIF